MPFTARTEQPSSPPNDPSKAQRHSLPGGGLRLSSTARVERRPFSGRAFREAQEDIGGRPSLPSESLLILSSGMGAD